MKISVVFILFLPHIQQAILRNFFQNFLVMSLLINFKNNKNYCNKMIKKNRFRCSKVYFNFFQPKLEKSKMSLYIKKAMKSAAEWNTSFQKERREERKAYLDLQTFVIIFSCYFLMLPLPLPHYFALYFFKYLNLLLVIPWWFVMLINF